MGYYGDRLVANYKANLEEDEGLNTDSNAMIDDKINDEGYGSGTIVNSEKFGARNDGATSANVSNFSSIGYISFPYAQDMMELEGVETDYISQH